MDQQTQNANEIEKQTAQTGGTTTAGNPAGTQSPENWLKRMRAPGMEINYSLQKRHIPDVSNAQGNGQNTGTAGRAGQSAGTPSPSPSGNAQDPTASIPGNGARDTMSCGGSCRVRYFDLAVGMAVALMACAMFKCCMGCCRCMKRKMF